MKLKESYFFILFFLVIPSKSILFAQKNNAEIITIGTMEKEQKNSINIDDLVNDISFVKLETNEKCAIINAMELKIYKDQIYVLDSFMSRGLFVFDMTGKFIRKIGNSGREKQEYGTPISFDFDSKKQEIIICSKAPYGLFHYDMKGNFKNEEQVDVAAVNFVINNKQDCYHYGTYAQSQRNIRSKNDNDKQFALTISNKTGDKNVSFLETNKAENSLMTLNKTGFFKNDSIILYSILLKNTIYEINHVSVNPRWVFDFEGNEIIPDTLAYNRKSYEVTKAIKKNNYITFDNRMGFFMIKNKLFFTIRRGKSLENYVYNTFTKKHYLIAPNNESDKAIIGAIKTVYNNNVVSCVYANKIANYQKKINNASLNAIIEKTKDQDNPIIIFSQIKD